MGGRDVPMKNPPHPGRSVRHDCLEPLGLTVTEAARRLGVSRKQLSELVNGRSGISPEMAIRLDKAFGGGAETWYRLQSAYDLAQAMKNAGQIHVERIPTPLLTASRTFDPPGCPGAPDTLRVSTGDLPLSARCPQPGAKSRDVRPHLAFDGPRLDIALRSGSRP